MCHIKTNSSLTLLFLFIVLQHAFAQTIVSPKYSVDGTVSAMLAKGDTLIMAGQFGNVGIYSGAAAMLTTTSDKPDLTFPKIVGNIVTSTPDGAGGYYVAGGFRKEADLWYQGYPRIEHIKADFTFDTAFSITTSSLFGIRKLLYHNGILFIGGSYVDHINGQVAGDLSAIDVATKQLVPWIPPVIRIYLGGVHGLFIAQNTLYITGGFDSVGGQNRKNIAAIEMNTGNIKAWNFGANWPTPKTYSDLEFYNDKLAISGSFDDGNGPSNVKHGCALTDTTTGGSLDYLFISSGLFGAARDYLYFAASVSNLAISGDTLFAYSGGTFDTRVVALHLASRTVLWARYFNMVAGATEMEVSGGALYIVGNYFTDVYKKNFTNDDPINIERKVKNALAINIANGNLHNWNPGPLGGVHTIDIIGSSVLMGGSFQYVNAEERTNIVMINTSTQKVLPFSSAKYDYSGLFALKIKDSILYAAGDIVYINNVYDPKSVVAFNLNTGATENWNVPYLGPVYSIEVNGQYVFAGGQLTEAGGAGRTNMFAIDRQTGALAAWAPNPNSRVNALHIKDGILYAGGNFTNTSGSIRNYIAAYDTLTLSLSTWNPNADAQVNDIKSDNNIIWAAGNFFKMGDTTCNYLVGIDDKNAQVTRNPAFSLGNNGINKIQQIGCFMVAGGSFWSNANISCNALAIYNMYDRTAVPISDFCIDVDDNYGDVRAFAKVGKDLYFGGTFLKVNDSIHTTHVERLRFPASTLTACGQYISVINGNYNDPATWLSGTVPPDNAKVTVRHTVTVTANTICYSLDVRPAGNIVVNAGATLTVIN